MRKSKFKAGDLVEYFETIYPKIHKIQRGIVVKEKYSGPQKKDVSKIYMVLTIENETNWVFEEDLIKLEDKC